MGRRKSGFDDLLKAASKLPWKVAAALAPVSFIVCRVTASVSLPVATSHLQDLGGVVLRGYIHTFASIFQYLLPLVFLIGAAVSFVKQARADKLLDGVQSDGVDVASLSWRDFERLVGAGFRRRGFAVSELGGACADGGVDLVLTRGSERFLVQCKQWRAQQVSVGVVRELYGVMAAEHAAGGFVVTSGSFTSDAKKFAQGRNIELIDGERLQGLLDSGPDAVPAPRAKQSAAHIAAAEPTCPACRTPMVVRTAKRGANAGSSFWGCAQYPKCRQTMVMGSEVRRSA